MDNKGIHILLIEDSAEDARLIRDMLSESGLPHYSLSHALTFSDGHDFLRNNSCDVTLLDLDLPDSSGHNSINAIRKDMPEIPVVLLTGNNEKKTALSLIHLGAQDYLVKGKIDGNLLARSLQYAIERKKAEKKLLELQWSNETLAKEVFEHKTMGRIIKMTNDLLKLYPRKYTRKDYLESVVNIIHDWSGCRCVGIRVLNKYGEIPYESYTGFDRDFWKSENCLSITKDQCVCTRIMNGKPELQDAPAMTSAGSFCCGNTFAFISGLTEQEKARFRGACVKNGFASVAVVPIRFLERMFAAIHLADEREELVSQDIIETLETLTPIIGEAIHRFNMEDELMNNYESLQTANELLEKVFSNVHVLIAYMDTEFNFIRVNNKYADAFGGEPELFVGKNHFTLHPHARTEEIFRKVIETGESYFVRAQSMAYPEKPERQTKFWDWSLVPVKDVEGKVSGLVLSLIEVTENIILYSELMRSEHLASIGRLAAGVAHEVNNPINGIINYAQMLLKMCAKESREHDIANRIIRESDRIAGIVRSLLSFARGETAEKSRVHVSEILADSLSLTQAHIRKSGIKLEVDIPPDLPMISAHPQRIEQVFLNLINNACYALNSKFREAHDDKMLRISAEPMTVNNDPRVRIMFYDNGTGIPEEIRGKILDPFFTTKPGSDGTGLGLSISHGIISDHSGILKIESLTKVYTKVIIDLPVHG